MGPTGALGVPRRAGAPLGLGPYPLSRFQKRKKESKFIRNCVKNWYLVCGGGGGGGVAGGGGGGGDEYQQSKVLRSRVYPHGQLPTINLIIYEPPPREI